MWRFGVDSKGDYVEGVRLVSVRLFSVAEAAKVVGMAEKALRRRIETGSVASVKQGSRRMIPEHEVDRLIAVEAIATSGEALGQGQISGGNSGTTSMDVIVRLSQAVEAASIAASGFGEMLEAATEKRVNAERDRDAAVERARGESEARQAAEAEIVELRARVMQLEAPSSVSISAPGADEVPSGSWWQRMISGGEQ